MAIHPVKPPSEPYQMYVFFFILVFICVRTRNHNALRLITVYFMLFVIGYKWLMSIYEEELAKISASLYQETSTVRTVVDNVSSKKTTE